MNILITGGNGFIGRNLKEYFEKNKIYNTFSPTEKELNLTNSGQVKDFFSKNQIHCIIHSATVLQINKQYNSDVCEQNLKMFFNLYRYKAKNAKLINLGSGSEYSREHWMPNMPESFFDNFIPQDSHSFSKYIMSKFIESSGDNNLIHLRIFGVFGKYEDYRFKFISNCIAKNLMDIPIVINQNAVYDYLYIDDFSKIIEKLVDIETEIRVLNVTPSKSSNLISINNEIQKALNVDKGFEVLNSGFGAEYTGDNTNLLDCIGGYDFMKIEQSIESMVEYYLMHKHLLNKENLLEDKFLDYAKKINPKLK
jgi:UDP-glucose 4-epimerase